MTPAHIASQIRSCYQDGIRIARSKGRTLTVPVLGSHLAAERIVRDTAAIGQEHGRTFLRVYEGMVALTLDMAQNGRSAFLTTGKIAAELSRQNVTGRVMTPDELRPILLRLASDGSVIAGGYGWIVTAFSDRHPNETRPGTFKGKAPVVTAPKRITAADVFGRTADAAPVAAPVPEWDSEMEPDYSGDEDLPLAPVTRATSDEWEPRPNVAPVVPTVADRRTASERAGHAVAASLTPESVAAIMRQVLTPEVLTAHLMGMPKTALARLIERATVPDTVPAPVVTAPARSPRPRRVKGETLRTTAPRT